MNKIMRIPETNKINLMGGRSINSSKLLISCLEDEDIQNMIKIGNKENVWNIMKQTFVFMRPYGLLHHSAKIIGYEIVDDNIENLINDIVKEMNLFFGSDLPKKIIQEQSIGKKIDIIAEYANGYIIKKFRKKKISYKYDDSITHYDLIEKIITLLNNEILREQVNREVSIYWKSALVWNFVKFNYSHEVNKGPKLNDDVSCIIKSFIPHSVRLEHLRLKYTDQFLFDGFMKKKQVTIRKIIILKIHRKYIREFNVRNMKIKVSGKKCEQVKRITEYFSKMEKIIKGSTFQTSIGYDKKISRAIREEYCKIMCEFLLLLVTIINTSIKR